MYKIRLYSLLLEEAIANELIVRGEKNYLIFCMVIYQVLTRLYCRGIMKNDSIYSLWSSSLVGANIIMELDLHQVHGTNYITYIPASYGSCHHRLSRVHLNMHLYSSSHMYGRHLWLWAPKYSLLLCHPN